MFSYINAEFLGLGVSIFSVRRLNVIGFMIDSGEGHYDDYDDDDVSNLRGKMTWRLECLGGIIKAKVMLLL